MKYSKLNRLVFLGLFISINSFAGGVSGGGGGTVPANPIAIDALERIISEERWELTLFFNKYEINQKLAGEGECQNQICLKLFDQDITIFDILKTATISFEQSRPCQSPDGSLTDGAAPGPDENSVCLSLYTLIKKLDEDNARPQALALLAHEFSHLAGLNENEAEEVQRRTLTAFLTQRTEELDSRKHALRTDLIKGFEYLKTLNEEAGSRNTLPSSLSKSWFDNARFLLSRSLDKDTDLYSSKKNYFSFLSWRELGLANALFWRISWAGSALSSMDKKELDGVFVNSTELTLEAALINNDRNSFNIDRQPSIYPYPDDEIVYRVVDIASYKKEIKKILSDYKKLYNKIFAQE